MQPKQNEEKTKHPYQKPRLRIIELAAEEVLGVGCKLINGDSAPGSPFNCIGNNCSGDGS